MSCFTEETIKAIFFSEFWELVSHYLDSNSNYVLSFSCQYYLFKGEHKRKEVTKLPSTSRVFDCIHKRVAFDCKAVIWPQRAAQHAAQPHRIFDNLQVSRKKRAVME